MAIVVKGAVRIVGVRAVKIIKIWLQIHEKSQRLRDGTGVAKGYVNHLILFMVARRVFVASLSDSSVR